jgi:hypothetical protein
MGGLREKYPSFARDSKTKKTGGKLWVMGTTLALNIKSTSAMLRTVLLWVITWKIVVWDNLSVPSSGFQNPKENL